MSENFACWPPSAECAVFTAPPPFSMRSISERDTRLSLWGLLRIKISQMNANSNPSPPVR